MLLKTSNRDLVIFQKLRSYKEVNVYLAKDGVSSSHNYLINEICCPQKIRSCIKELLTLREEKAFSEFVDIFSLNSKLYLVFKYTKPLLMVDYLNKNKLSFAEKVTLLENYLFQLTAYTNLPIAIRYALTDLENINVHPNEAVYFNFSIKPQHLSESNDKSTIFSSIASLIKVLFTEELRVSKGRQLLLLVEKCDKSIYRSVPEIIKDVKNIDTSSSLNKVQQYFQERKSKLAFVKDFAMAALIVMLVVIVYTKFISPSTTGSGSAVSVSQIGEVILLEDPIVDTDSEIPSIPAEPTVIRIE